MGHMVEGARINVLVQKGQHDINVESESWVMGGGGTHKCSSTERSTHINVRKANMHMSLPHNFMLGSVSTYKYDDLSILRH